MTRYNKEMIERMRQDVIGKTIEAFYYEEKGDYYVITFAGGAEFSFRLMADLINE